LTKKKEALVIQAAISTVSIKVDYIQFIDIEAV
jgi:hypothetical protein